MASLGITTSDIRTRGVDTHALQAPLSLYNSHTSQERKGAIPHIHRRLLDDLRQRNDTIVVSTDGSRRSIQGTKKTGAGIIVMRGDITTHEYSIGLGRRTNLYDEESIALAMGMRAALRYCDAPILTPITPNPKFLVSHLPKTLIYIQTNTSYIVYSYW